MKNTSDSQSSFVILGKSCRIPRLLCVHKMISVCVYSVNTTLAQEV